PLEALALCAVHNTARKAQLAPRASTPKFAHIVLPAAVPRCNRASTNLHGSTRRPGNHRCSHPVGALAYRVGQGAMAVVLIVDDEAQLRILAETIIQELGHEALTAASAREALALVEARPDINVLFTDIGLQPDGEGGLELARCVIARRPALPI